MATGGWLAPIAVYGEGLGVYAGSGKRARPERLAGETALQDWARAEHQVVLQGGRA